MSLDPELDSVQSENAIIIKAPIYGTSDPRVWFLQIEAFFRFRKITSQSSMFSYVVTQIPTDVAKEIADMIDPMPDDCPYDKLKSAILKRTTKSEESMLQQLLTDVELGDRSPSQLLRHMKALVGNSNMSDTILRQLWLKCLPLNTTVILSVQDSNTPLDKLADIADKVHECFFKQSVNVVSPATSDEKPNEKINELQQQISQLTITVNSLAERITRSRSPSRNRFLSRSRAISNEKSSVCYYHRRFGSKAFKCTKPCSFSASSPVDTPLPGNRWATQ